MKKIFVLLYTICFAIIFIGCKKVYDTNNIISTDEIIYSEKDIGCTKAELEKASEDVDIIIQSLNNRDISGIKSVLIEEALQDEKDTDREIEYVFNMLEEKIVNTEEYKLYSYEMKICGEKRFVLCIEYDVYTKNSKYLLELVYLPRKDTELSDVGVFSLRLADYSRTDENYLHCFTPYNVAGVFSSDKNTIEENTEKLSNVYEEYFYSGTMCVRLVQYLNAVGAETIKDIRMIEHKESGSEILITDNLNHKYYVTTYVSGDVLYIQENDKEGEYLFYPIQ